MDLTMVSSLFYYVIVDISWHLDISELFGQNDKMFYHQMKTSNDLCSVGLFTLERESETKKHKMMKCKYVALDFALFKIYTFDGIVFVILC